MSYNFVNKVGNSSYISLALSALGAKVSDKHRDRLHSFYTKWNFYEGYHWQDLPVTNKPTLTVNYCRKFVDKFIAFELGNGFSIKMKAEMESLEDSPLTFLNEVWKDNDILEFCTELGQSKNVTGESWVGVFFYGKGQFPDPFNLYEKGRIRVLVVPTSICFPEFDDGYDKSVLKKLTIMYPIEVDVPGLLSRGKVIIYKQEWTADMFVESQGDKVIKSMPNKYGFIPFRQIKNFPLQGSTEGIGDIDDVVPLNMEYNLKCSDVSEIIDYHSAPVTVVFGARIGQLERGANKVWGGLPKDAKVENLQLEGDLDAAQSYINNIKKAMMEVGSVPEEAFGGNLAISNTSGVALHIAMMPVLERVKVKHIMTKEGLQYVNMMILKIALDEKLITKPDNVSFKDFFSTDIHFESVLPKDSLIELQNIESEMTLGLEDRRGAMRRLKRDNIEERIKNIDKDRQENPAIYGLNPDGTLSKSKTNNTPGMNKDGERMKTNSGVTNSPVPKK